MKLERKRKMTLETYELIQRGIEEEKKQGGCVLHEWPEYETQLYYELYEKMDEVPDWLEELLHSVAHKWDIYFTFGEEKYKEYQKQRLDAILGKQLFI